MMAGRTVAGRALKIMELAGVVLICTVATIALQPVMPAAGRTGNSPAVSERAQRFAPGERPDRIVLTWTADPARSQAVTWRTVPAGGTPAAQIAAANANPRFRADAEVVHATTTAVNTAEHGVVHYHTADFRDLAPNTTYAYRVGNGTAWSEWFQFRTASDKPDPFSFIYLGDAQTDILSLWSRTLRAAFSFEPAARFILHAGDLVNRPNDDGQWGEWFAAGSWIYGMVPSAPVAGNHEHTEVDHDNRFIRKLAGSHLSRLWTPQFALPANGPAELAGTVYHLDVQGVRLIVLNSSSRSTYRMQGRWLEQLLSDNPQRWTIVAFHHPVHPSSMERTNPLIAREWQPILERYDVDLVLQGHDHSYMRLASPGGDGHAATVGPVYVVSVAGPKMYARADASAMDASLADAQLYQIIRVDGDRIHFEARVVTGELFDAFELVRTTTGAKRLIERGPDAGDNAG